jgi:hypothetical protein
VVRKPGGEPVNLGVYDTEVEAATAYDRYVKRMGWTDKATNGLA